MFIFKQVVVYKYRHEDHLPKVKMVKRLKYTKSKFKLFKGHNNLGNMINKWVLPSNWVARAV